jgi:flagellin-like hook-associated protein FlgL
MRVPFNSSQNQFIRDVNSLKLQQTQLSRQLSTGQKVAGISDNASAAARATSAATEKGRIQIFSGNINRAESISNFSIEVLQSFKKISDSAYRLATTNDGLSSDMDLKSREADLRQLVEQGIQSLNSRFGGSYLFAGANVSEKPFVAHRYTEFLEDAGGNYIDINGNPIAAGDPPVRALMRNTAGDIIFDPVLASSGDPIPEGTYVDPATGFQTDSSGVPLPGPLSIDTGIDFNSGELVALDPESGLWEVVLDPNGNVIVPQNPDPSGTGLITTTRTLPSKYIGEVYRVEYTGSTDRSDDVRFRVSENGQFDPFSRGSQNEGYGEILNNMIALRDAFQSEDLSEVNDRAESLDGSRDNAIGGIVELAAKLSGIKTLESINAARFNELENTISNAVDADIAETIIELNRLQIAYEAALSSGSRILSLSLLEFLR